MRLIFLTLMLAVCTGCGTMRYRVITPTDGRHVKTEVQWEIVELKFNDVWKAILPEAWRQ